MRNGVIQLVIQATRKKKFRVLPTGVELMTLLVTRLDALPLSYRRLVEDNAIEFTITFMSSRIEYTTYRHSSPSTMQDACHMDLV